MSLHFAIERLDANARVFAGLCTNISAEQARWQPAPGKWSIVEVVNHLYDEERDDFRARLRFILEKTPGEMPPIAPEQWAAERRYRERDLDESLRQFLEERQRSLNWLKELERPNWRLTHHHPRLGPMSAEMMLANWLAHDFLHIRQLNRLHYEYLSTRFSGVALRYAGNW